MVLESAIRLRRLSAGVCPTAIEAVRIRATEAIAARSIRILPRNGDGRRLPGRGGTGKSQPPGRRNDPSQRCVHRQVTSQACEVAMKRIFISAAVASAAMLTAAQA